MNRKPFRPLRAMALKAEGLPEEARSVWIADAIHHLQTLEGVDDAGFRAGVGEAVACLASALAVYRKPPLLKDGVRAVVKRFLDRTYAARP